MDQRILLKARRIMVIGLMYLFAFCFVAYSVFGLGLFFMQSRFVYNPSKDVFCNPEDIGLEYKDISFQAEDGLKLSGWYVPAAGSKFTVLFCHGNGGNIMHRLDSIDIFNNLGLSCFIFDYRGYGSSEGEPTEEGTYLDASAAYNWLRGEEQAKDIIILGRSLGGSIAAELAGKVPAAGLVLESVFTSYLDIGRKYYPYMPVKWFAKFKYPTIDYIKDVNCPVMILHSRDDELVGFEFGRKLYSAANEPKKFVEISGKHNEGFLSSGAVYTDAWKTWVQFLDEK